MTTYYLGKSWQKPITGVRAIDEVALWEECCEPDIYPETYGILTFCITRGKIFYHEIGGSVSICVTFEPEDEMEFIIRFSDSAEYKKIDV